MRNRLKDGWQDDIAKLLPKPPSGGIIYLSVYSRSRGLGWIGE